MKAFFIRGGALAGCESEPGLNQEMPKKELLAGQVRKANTFWTRFRGLQLRKALEPEEALLLDPCSSIHSFFMRFRFDAVFLDEKNTVLKAVSGIPSWCPYVGQSSACRVLELPAGRIVGTGIHVGDCVAFVLDRGESA